MDDSELRTRVRSAVRVLEAAQHERRGSLAAARIVLDVVTEDAFADAVDAHTAGALAARLIDAASIACDAKVVGVLAEVRPWASQLWGSCTVPAQHSTLRCRSLAGHAHHRQVIRRGDSQPGGEARRR
jgi:DNA-binding transcriptional regulator/RsmH inhibitor MraZ